MIQIGYIICLVDAINKTNIIHLFFINCKRVIRSILVVKLYEMAYKFNTGAVIKVIIRKILGLAILTILRTNLKFLCDCLIKLNVIKKNILILNIMRLY